MRSRLSGRLLLQRPRCVPRAQRPAYGRDRCPSPRSWVSPLPVRQWVLSFAKRLRYSLRQDREALNTALGICLDEIERHLRAQSPGAGPEARAGAVAFIHRFGSSLNLHTHFPVCLTDSVFEPDPHHGGWFVAGRARVAGNAKTVQVQGRRRVLSAFVRRGRLEKEEPKEMGHWDPGGGFSLDAALRIAANDRNELKRRLHDCARPAFAAERLEALDAHRLIYPLPKPGLDGRTQLILSPLELIARNRSLPPPTNKVRS